MSRKPRHTDKHLGDVYAELRKLLACQLHTLPAGEALHLEARMDALYDSVRRYCGCVVCQARNAEGREREGGSVSRGCD